MAKRLIEKMILKNGKSKGVRFEISKVTRRPLRLNSKRPFIMSKVSSGIKFDLGQPRIVFFDARIRVLPPANPASPESETILFDGQRSDRGQ